MPIGVVMPTLKNFNKKMKISICIMGVSQGERKNIWGNNGQKVSQIWWKRLICTPKNSTNSKWDQLKRDPDWNIPYQMV